MAKQFTLPISSSRRGFTVIELLVVVGIIVLLASIAIPMAMRAYRNAEISRVRMDLQTLSTALEAFKQDHGDYPRVTNYGGPADPTKDSYRGAIVLAQALVAPADGDGADGPGFRVRGTQGKVYGPYVKPETFRMSSDPSNPTGTLDTSKPLLFDKTGKPILYYPGNAAKPNLALAGMFTGNTAGQSPALYNFADNTIAFRQGSESNDTNAIKRWRLLLGDHTGTDGKLDSGESAKTTGPFLLWSAGPDGVFGPSTDAASPSGTLDAADAAVCDDITNFNE